jgi:hypothetical protein
MNTVPDRKTQSVGGRNSSSARGLELSEKHSLALLGFFTFSGLLSVIASVFTTMLTSGALRDFWLAVCIAAFITLLVGITRFFLSYQSHGATRMTNSR